MKILLTIISLLVLSIACTSTKHAETPIVHLGATAVPRQTATAPKEIATQETETVSTTPTTVPITPLPTVIPRHNTPVIIIRRPANQPTIKTPNEYVGKPSGLFTNAFVKPTNTPRPTRQPTPEPTLAYSIGAITKYYSAPSFNVHDIQVRFITHTLHSNGTTYPQDTCYGVKYIDRQGKSQTIKLKFSLFNYNQQDEYIQLYEVSSPGTFDDAGAQGVQQALTNLKNDKEKHGYTCN